jgi:hypothetical protein
MDWLRWQLGQHKGVIFAVRACGYGFGGVPLVPCHMQNPAPGFGPDWECTPQAQGDPTCIKKIRP